jgi:hypothetical protein
MNCDPTTILTLQAIATCHCDGPRQVKHNAGSARCGQDDAAAVPVIKSQMQDFPGIIRWPGPLRMVGGGAEHSQHQNKKYR